ncbi:hypothetical protein SAMN05444506_104249 [Pseudomonas syringae]|uniref:hypothetical protein n=1 Tax=Pseudomonas syringae group TaxID=136849 RepID=UPI000895C535|nr:MULTISPECIES: hypothetical protein [Pseudomonas syringae group]SDY64322.1 hypothetical protein SAMN05444506_104249 [Pseudomonas syringae]
MAPRNPPGTPRINTGHDIGYQCVNQKCKRSALALGAVNYDNWTCPDCDHPVHVDISYGANLTKRVRRICAKDVKQGIDQMYLPRIFETAHLVTTSEMGQGKTYTFEWRLYLTGYGMLSRMPNEYVDVVP